MSKLNKILLFANIVIVIVIVIVAVANAWTNPTANPPGGGGALFFRAGNVGIGTTAPTERLTIAGGHHNTTLRFSAGGFGQPAASNDAFLSLWASEPHWTWTGAGIGNNILGSAHFGRINTARGASYMRLLDSAITFDTINSAGTRFADTLFMSGGNVGIGTATPNSRLEVAGTIHSTTGGFRFPDNTTQTTAAIHGKQLFTTSGTFIVPPRVTRVWVTMSGGGGGGGGGIAAAGAAGGGGGGGGANAVIAFLQTVSPGAAITVTVGAGGAGAINGTVDAGVGGATSFGSLVSAGGGNGGSAVAGGLGGVAGGPGGVAGTHAAGGGAGGGSIFGAGGAGGAGIGSGAAGGGYGGGGGGGAPIVSAGGAGSPGFVLVEW